MKRRRVLAVLGGASLFGSVALGSGGFSTTSADREVAVDVVGDEDAYLALKYPQRVSADCGATVTLTVANHTTTALHAVEIEFAFDGSTAAIDEIEPSNAEFGVSEDGQTVSLASTGVFAAGDSVTLDVTLTGFEGRGSAGLSFDVAAGSETDAMAIETTSSRTVGVDYTCHVGPAGCPLSVPSVSPAPASDAADGLESDDSITVSTDVDGSVVTTGGDGDVTVAGAESDRVQITGRVEAGGAISSVTDADIGGSVVANDGDIGGAIKRASIGGDVRTAAGSSGDVSIDGSRNDRVQIAGRVEADGEISGLTDADIGGDVVANDDIGGAVERARIGGDVWTTDGSDGDISVTDTTVCGAVRADGDVTVESGTEIGGDVADGNDVTVSNSTVGGDINARGDVDIGPSSTVRGVVDAGGDVTVGTDSVVEGDVSAGGEVSGSGTIAGRDPRDD